MLTDGGRYTETFYGWYDGETDTYLTHVEVGDDFASPFFEEEGDARRYLEHVAELREDTSGLEDLSLRKLKAKKVGEAVEILTDQAGIGDYFPDGGTVPGQSGNETREEGVTTVHYLQWHQSEPLEDSDASDLFHDFHHDPPGSLGESTFSDLYQEVAETGTRDLEQVFKEWNHGSGVESTEFLGQRYCEECHTYLDGSRRAIRHAELEHGYNPRLQPGEPEYVRGIRSISVGDVLENNGQLYACLTVGWGELELLEEAK